LNCSTLDGWWDEAYDGCNGFAFGNGRTHVDVEVHDDNDVKSLYEVLENQVVPTFYDRDERGVPIGWVGHIKHALRSLGWRYNSDRMVRDYATQGYLPARNAVTSDFR
jgi:starch phosphorylase